MIEVWLRGPLTDTPILVQPAAHALLQAREEVESYVETVDDTQLWTQPAGAASVGFHLQHLTGVLDRLFTYARGETLSQTQLETFEQEGKPTKARTARTLVAAFSNQIDSALEQLKTVDASMLAETRYVGRKQLPTTLLGLYVHAAEHTMRHVGQLLVTVKVLAEADNEVGDEAEGVRYSINSFDDNNLAMLESEHDTIPVPRSFLPAGCREGDVLLLEERRRDSSSQLVFRLDSNKTRERLEAARGLRASLKRAPQGNMKL